MIMGLLHAVIILMLPALTVSSILPKSDLDSDSTYAIAAQLTNLDSIHSDITTLKEKFDSKLRIFHATKEGLIAFHIDQDSKDQILHHITSDISNAQVLNIEKVPDIKIKNGWKTRRHKRDLKAFDLESYNTYPSIYEFLLELARRYPQICETEVIGTTYEDREIRVVRIHGANNNSSAKVRVFIDGAQHAREWISPAVLVYMINKLVTGYAENNEWIVSVLDKYEFNIVPILNPDGYEYTYNVSGARFWRKNRKQSEQDGACWGVDLNRNWGFHWSGMGASPYKCSDIYHGVDEFSEEETKAASDYIKRYSGSWHSYFSFHSFGQMILFPWSHSSVPNPDHFKHLSASKAMAEGIKILNNVTYAVGSVGNLLYAASGSSESWAYGKAEIPYSYTLELPDLYRFIIPKERIAPTAVDIMMGFQYYFDHIEDTRPELYPQLLNASLNVPPPAPTTPTTQSTTLNTTASPSASETPTTIQLQNSPIENEDEGEGEGVLSESTSRSSVSDQTTTLLTTKTGAPPSGGLLRTKPSTLLPLIIELSQSTPVNAQSTATTSRLTRLLTQSADTKDVTDTLPNNIGVRTTQSIQNNNLGVRATTNTENLSSSFSNGAESVTMSGPTKSTAAKPLDCRLSRFPCSESQGTTTPMKCQSGKCSMTHRSNDDPKLVILEVRSHSYKSFSCSATLLLCYLVTFFV